jgi:hypothetical protein
MSFAAPLFHVEAVQGTTARLPCNLTSPIEGDRVSLVIWYKEGQSTPIYSFDVRHTEVLAKGLHHEGTGGLSGRSHFNTTSLPSFIISNVKGHDNGLYRCRADFIKSPTRNIKIQLSVIGKISYHYRNAYKHSPNNNIHWPCDDNNITRYLFLLLFIYNDNTVPPESIAVLNDKGMQIPHYILGPYNEGSSINISCVATGGEYIIIACH